MENGQWTIYPNPIIQSSIISYQLLETTNVNIKIYDLMGKEIETIVNDAEQARET